MKKKTKEVTYCIYCHKTQQYINKMTRRQGYCWRCDERGTPEGFHSYGIKRVEVDE